MALTPASWHPLPVEHTHLSASGGCGHCSSLGPGAGWVAGVLGGRDAGLNGTVGTQKHPTIPALNGAGTHSPQVTEGKHSLAYTGTAHSLSAEAGNTLAAVAPHALRHTTRLTLQGDAAPRHTPAAVTLPYTRAPLTVRLPHGRQHQVRRAELHERSEVCVA